jgi:EAL domain-containing protein (putative c-di-GMP-specific phosphodiesterase class I)
LRVNAYNDIINIIDILDIRTDVYENQRSMHKLSDLMLILEPEPEAQAALAAVAERLGCEHIEADSVEKLQEVLAVRRPTIAVLAVDQVDTNYLAVLDALADHDVRPVTLLVGCIGPRILASAKRAAETRRLAVLGVDSRPLDVIAVERLLTPHLSVGPPIARVELEQALVEHEFVLLYQPKLAIAAGATQIQGVEALIRWRHPRRGLLQPRHFLDAVENLGLMSQVTDYVMMEAVRQGGQWRATGVPLEIIVNLSTKLVQDRGFPERLAILLRENEFPPHQLILDVTETLRVEDQNLLLDVFTRLRILGVGLSLDNFGTGLSSLTELYRMPFSEIKVDHSLIADVAREREARVIVKAIVDLAHTLRLSVCAEGVETRQMLEFVRGAQFDTAQGRFFSEPVLAADVERIIGTWPSAGPAATGSWCAAEPLDFDGSMKTHRALRARHAQGETKS